MREQIRIQAETEEKSRRMRKPSLSTDTASESNVGMPFPSAAPLMRMQQTQGNAAVCRMLARRGAAVQRTAVQRDDDQNNAGQNNAGQNGSAPDAAPAANSGSVSLASLDQDAVNQVLGEAGSEATTADGVQRDGPDAGTPSVNANIVAGPTYNPDAAFVLTATWQTNQTSGFIVQQVMNSQTITDANNPNNTRTDNQTYWEAWNVGANNGVTPVDQGVNDVFNRPPITPIVRIPTTGGWSKIGMVYWVPQLDPAANFQTGGVRNAGTLLMSTLTRPTNLGSSLATRSYGGQWDSSDPNNMTHTPT